MLNNMHKISGLSKGNSQWSL